MMSLPTPLSRMDERFLDHRLRSTSIAGVAGALVAIGLLTYHYYVNDVWRWDLFAVAATMAGVKIAFMIWYRLTN